jgi:hypothetical protein
MMMITYSKQLMETKVESELFFMKRRVCSTTFLGNVKCHQNPKVTEYPLQDIKELSPTIDAFGVLGIKWAMGVLNLISRSCKRAWEMKFISYCMV